MNYRRLAVLVLVAGSLVSCGTTTKTATKTTTSATSANAGAPGDPEKSDRILEVHIRSDHRYDPPSIVVSAGETVTFRVTNDDDRASHQFVIGNAKTQNDDETVRTDPVTSADAPNIVDFEPRQSKLTTWTFPSNKGTEIIYGSHRGGDYAAGLKGMFTVG
ncbi:MAG: cupredoxin domain-containing protein [Actinomycetota bacterium]|nr:cupredoxin domain-containing protein [Actinomycetota bacterium]